jgi:hypothetical protein
MRKVLLITAASCALIALLPATALAKHGDRRHHHHHAHHARVHHRTFGHDRGNGIQGQPAGTVVSFTNGVLTIMASDGTTASGRVTNATEIRCERAEPAEFEHHDRGRGGDGGGDNGRGDDQGDNDDNGNDEVNEMCTTADLVSGAMVQEARLSISGAGATWDEVELIVQSSGSSDS